VGESVEKDFVREEALASTVCERVRWEGAIPCPIAQGGSQVRVVFTTQEHWEMVNKEAPSLQRAHNARF